MGTTVRGRSVASLARRVHGRRQPSHVTIRRMGWWATTTTTTMAVAAIPHVSRSNGGKSSSSSSSGGTTLSDTRVNFLNYGGSATKDARLYLEKNDSLYCKVNGALIMTVNGSTTDFASYSPSFSEWSVLCEYDRDPNSHPYRT